MRVAAVIILALACLGAGPARAGVEAQATATFEFSAFSALPSAWVPELQASIQGDALFSRSGAELPDGLLVRVTFLFPGGVTGGVLTLDLAHAHVGAVYGLDDASVVGWEYYEVGPGGVELRADTVDGSAEVVVLDEHPTPAVRVSFDARVESHGPDGVPGTDDDQARELTRGTVATSWEPATPPGGAGTGGGTTTGASSGGSDGSGVVIVDGGDPWAPEAPAGPPIAIGFTTYDDTEGCGSGTSDDDGGGCSSDDQSSEGGGCGGTDTDTDTDTSDGSSSGCSGDDASSDSACESDATAAPRSGGTARSYRHRRIVGAIPFTLLLCAVVALRRRARLP